MASTSLALAALRGAIAGAIRTLPNPTPGNAWCKVFVGWPTGPKLSETLGQPVDRAMVSLWALPATDATRYAAASVADGVREIGRHSRLVQVSIWCKRDDIRTNIADAIMANVGTVAAPFIAAADGTSVWCAYAGDRPNDNASGTYSNFRWDMNFKLEYGISQAETLTPVTSVTEEIDVDGITTTSTSGGSS